MDKVMGLLFTYLKDQIIGKAGEALTYFSKASIDLFSNSLVTNLLSFYIKNIN